MVLWGWEDRVSSGVGADMEFLSRFSIMGDQAK